MQIVLGPVLTRKGGYAFDCWTPEKGLSRGYTESLQTLGPSRKLMRIEVERGLPAARQGGRTESSNLLCSSGESCANSTPSTRRPRQVDSCAAKLSTVPIRFRKGVIFRRKGELTDPSPVD
jgi:hypothetical protein